MNYRTLLLNVAMVPQKSISWEDAVTLLYQKKAIVLEEYDETISSPTRTWYVPAVIKLTHSIRTNQKAIRFSRVNVLSRDNYRCQYCGARKTAKELNYDHVVPRRQGGKTTWENIVMSCFPCNERKGGRTPDEAGMKLLKHPARPHKLPLHTVFVIPGEIPEPWKPYLQHLEQHGPGYYISKVG